ncbi:TetR/AcrR family transcriptional regulator C-terminal domain-containing protein [Nonomuraea sp. SMC257]|uniref:TetR/AcrR family transcriptional regulator C-terminal domain-containing protein n=1 Tax=Nonomuraea montanisoli TaxID=2741721 RepID=A0A7Y6IK26_9ACTN|nr:TetR/AcrR family transcriptional regulator C-terminal domain-containing protein [Nonomuraea montanisoli]NUW38289.1 TetR/AcrR family transcriptional regulator C-terminal domain-containing protein [Nonomuraea montanisoli]
MSKQISSVWTREPRPARTPGRSREEIVRATLELLDAEGLDGLSMRKLGARLGSGATTIYWYVENKDELLELAYDHVWGQIALPVPEELGWRDTITTFAHSMRRVMLFHPWVGSLIGRLPALGPNALSMSDRLRKAFALAGFEGLDIDYANAALTAYVFGTVIPEIAWQSSMGGEELDQESMKETFRHVARDFPDLLERLTEINDKVSDTDTLRETSFAFGLTTVLDGLEARLRS